MEKEGSGTKPYYFLKFFPRGLRASYSGHDIYLQAKAAELSGDFNTAILLYKKAEKLGHDLEEDGSPTDDLTTSKPRSQKTFEDLENSEVS
jgi:hypothetical protein